MESQEWTGLGGFMLMDEVASSIKPFRISKITHNGTSLLIYLPKELVAQLGLSRGQKVLLGLDLGARRLVLEPI